MTLHLRATDLAIVAAYLIGITLFGLRFREKSTDPGARSLRSYFLANNTIPWWAIALSIVSAETSTLTIISIPGVAFAGDFGFLQVVIGYMLGRIVVALLFLPRYFSGNMLTAYQLIDQRFGRVLHKVTAGLFLLTRAAAEGVRVFAVSIVVGIAIGTRDILSIAIISALTLLYTFEGGMAAVIWTDVVQMAIYIGGTAVAIWSLGHHIPGGWSTIHTVASAAGKFHLLNFTFNLTTTYTFWAGVLGGTFLTMASHGTDQLMVQRMLAARNLRESQLALLSSGVIIFIQFALFLLIGAGLYVFYNTPSGPWALHPGPSFTSADRIFPTFIVHEMPLGIAGLLVAAILAAAMSNLSAALNSLSSTTVVDFYLHLRPSASDRERNLISKSSTLLWALVLFAIAVYALSVGGKGHVVEIGLSIASVAYGCLLGVFLLGTLTKFATQTGATLGMLCGFALNLWLWQGSFPKTFFGGDVLHCPTNSAAADWSHCTTSGITIPHIAWTWYVLIGALVTFALGSLFSLLFRKQSKRTTAAAAIATALLFAVILTLSNAMGKDPRIVQAQTSNPPTIRYPEASASGLIARVETGALAPRYALPQAPTAPDFTPISTLLNTAIAAHHLPGAVVLIGHNNHIVFEQAYGDRKLAGEPGLDGQPSPAEPMTEDTIFDMASLSKCLSTATAIMQLYEAGKITSFDDPVEKYLPAFNADHDPTRAKVTLRMLLTHTSGEAPDVSLKSPWGLATPDKAEGLHLALTTPLKSAPGDHFEYSDINFILLGDIVEKLSGLSLDEYAKQGIFWPLSMGDTNYHSFAETCEPKTTLGSAILYSPVQVRHHTRNTKGPCDDWRPNQTIPRTAPTAHDNEGTPATNPDYDHLLRGTVHDPTTRRMGGVAGHAGVFSTAHDVSLFASALLEKLLHNTGPFPLKQSTLQLMTSPQQPGHTPQDLANANAAQAAAIAESSAENPTDPHPEMGLSSRPERSAVERPAAAPAPLPGLAPHYPAIKGLNIHGLGWDIDTAFSKPRGKIFPIGSFGHTGFTGTSLWMDPYSDTYVILLANAIHPHVGAPLSTLRGQIATAAAQALHLLYTPTNSVISTGAQRSGETPVLVAPTKPAPTTNRYPEASASGLISPQQKGLQPLGSALPVVADKTLTGIDVLESTHFAALANLHHIALLTNQTGLDSHGARTIDILNHDHPLTTLFSPEHGIFGREDTEHLSAETDPTTHLPVTILFGSTDADKRPTHDQLKDLDAVVIDLQDAGVRYWTYEAATAYFLEAASREQTEYHHDLEIILLDRPNPLGGLQVQGPVSDANLTSYIAYMPLPVRHGLTLGELCRYIVATKHLATHLTVIPMQHWHRSDYFADTGLPWISPSPNLRSLTATLLYPALGFLDYTRNVSVGRGTNTPFELFAAGLSEPSKTSVILSEGAWPHPAPQPKDPNASAPATAAQTISASDPKPAAPGLPSATNRHPEPAAPGLPSATNRYPEASAPGLPSATNRYPEPAAPGLPSATNRYPEASASGLIPAQKEKGALAPQDPWFNAPEVAAALTARHIPGVTFAASTTTVAEDANHYPFHGQTIPAVRISVTDRNALDSPELGIEILSILHRLYPTQFKLDRTLRLLGSRSTLEALQRDDDPRSIALTWTTALDQFKAATAPFLLYP